jgi:hypothetical protein
LVRKTRLTSFISGDATQTFRVSAADDNAIR